MALRDTIQQIADDMGRLQAFAITPLKELDVNAFEGFPDISVSIGAELASLVTARKSIDKALVGIKKKITDAVKTNLDTL